MPAPGQTLGDADGPILKEGRFTDGQPPRQGDELAGAKETGNYFSIKGGQGGPLS